MTRHWREFNALEHSYDCFPSCSWRCFEFYSKTLRGARQFDRLVRRLHFSRSNVRSPLQTPSSAFPVSGIYCSLSWETSVTFPPLPQSTARTPFENRTEPAIPTSPLSRSITFHRTNKNRTRTARNQPLDGAFNNVHGWHTGFLTMAPVPALSGALISQGGGGIMEPKVTGGPDNAAAVP